MTQTHFSAQSGDPTDPTRSHLHDRQDAPSPDDPALSDRRIFMKRLMITSGAAAFATMGGLAGSAAYADDTTPATSTTITAAPPDQTTPGAAGGGESVSDDFFGLTTHGYRQDDLFSIHSTGVSTAGVVAAAKAFLATLDSTQLAAAQFDVRSVEWRQWSNVDSYARNGVELGALSDTQKAAGLAMVSEGLSARGLTLTDTIRRINGVAGRTIGSTETFNEEYYFFTIMGTPSRTQPWGWQFEGHHLVLNYFVLGSQVVMTPTFLGSEPTSVTDDETGAELAIFDDFFVKGLAAVNALSVKHRKAAILSATKDADNNVAEAFKDNVEVPYVGVRANTFDKKEKRALIALVAHFLGVHDRGHARVKLHEFKEHLDKTYFAWVGGTDDDAVFWLRVQSPVLYIEFDCELPGPLGSVYGAGQGSGPSRQHVHAVVRTPNGNDYGKELLRLHYATSPHHRSS